MYEGPEETREEAMPLTLLEPTAKIDTCRYCFVFLPHSVSVQPVVFAKVTLANVAQFKFSEGEGTSCALKHNSELFFKRG